MQTREPELAAVLRALSDDTRLKVVELVAQRPRRAGQLAGDLDVTPSTMSKHLRVLLKAGIVVDERHPDDSRVRIFRMRQASIVSLRAWLDQMQAHWDEQLGSFKQHVERKDRR
jgi:DNA-binding transcriptional ArsR family regulator